VGIKEEENMVFINNVSRADATSEGLARAFQLFAPFAKKIAAGFGKITELEAQELEDLSKSGKTVETIRATNTKRGPAGIVKKETTDRTETIDPAKHAEYLRKVSAPQIARAADRFGDGIIQVGNNEINLLSAARTLFEIFEAFEPSSYNKGGEPSIFDFNTYREAAPAPNGKDEADATSGAETNPQPPENVRLDLGPIGELVGGEEGLFVFLSTLKPETLGALATIIQKVKAAKEGTNQATVEGNNA
jgi:hypothetical protein